MDGGELCWPSDHRVSQTLGAATGLPPPLLDYALMNLPIVIPKNIRAQRRAYIGEVVFWRDGQIWLVRDSSYASPRRRPALFLDLYLNPQPPPPTPDCIDHIVDLLRPAVPKEEATAFAIHSAILRATAREFYA
jgi:hypothetical protein